MYGAKSLYDSFSLLYYHKLQEEVVNESYIKLKVVI